MASSDVCQGRCGNVEEAVDAETGPGDPRGSEFDFLAAKDASNAIAE